MKKKHGKCPGWLQRNEDGTYEEIGPFADTVRAIFQCAIYGLSPKAIAEYGPKPIGTQSNSPKAWSENSIERLLKSHAPYGGRERKDGTIEIVYPETVPHEDWLKAQEVFGDRPSGFERSGILLSGLMYCECKTKLRYRGHPQNYVECPKGCVKTFDYEIVEALTLKCIGGDCMVIPQEGEYSPTVDDPRRALRVKMKRLEIAVMLRRRFIDHVQLSMKRLSVVCHDGTTRRLKLTA